MALIIAGHLQQQEQAGEMVESLVDEGFARDGISTFYLNPAGQHDLYPIGGDRDKSPGAKEAGKGSVAGMAAGGIVGGAVGAVGIAVAGPLAPAAGALVGAHIGSLAGSLNAMKEKGETEPGREGFDNAVVQRRSGLMVAVCLPDDAEEEQVIHTFQRHGAQQIERAEGEIRAGDWIDFDPLSVPAFVNPEQAKQAAEYRA